MHDDGEKRSLLQHDIALYGWSVVWEFASYVTDRMVEEDFDYPTGTVSQWTRHEFAPSNLFKDKVEQVPTQ